MSDYEADDRRPRERHHALGSVARALHGDGYASPRPSPSSSAHLAVAAAAGMHTRTHVVNPGQPNPAQQILDAILYVIISTLEFVGSILGFILSHMVHAVATGQPWALVLLGLILIFSFSAMVGGNGSGSSHCGTCGGQGRKHEDWCRRGRWGGRQRWRND